MTEPCSRAGKSTSTTLSPFNHLWSFSLRNGGWCALSQLLWGWKESEKLAQNENASEEKETKGNRDMEGGDWGVDGRIASSSSHGAVGIDGDADAIEAGLDIVFHDGLPYNHASMFHHPLARKARSSEARNGRLFYLADGICWEQSDVSGGGRTLNDEESMTDLSIWLE